MVSRGIRNNNVGNIRKSAQPWRGKIIPSKDSAFEQFSNVLYGIRALQKLLISYVRQGFNTPAKIISKYAPSVENDTSAYITAFEKTTGIGRNTILDFSKRDDFYQTCKAIALHESGYHLTLNQFNSALNLV